MARTPFHTGSLRHFMPEEENLRGLIRVGLWIIWTWCLVVTLPSSVLYARDGEEKYNRKVSTDQNEALPKRGVLFEVNGPKGKAYLFGTVHVGRPEFYPLDRTTTQAMASSRFLAVEADVSDQRNAALQVLQHAMYRPPASLDQAIDPLLLSRVEAVLKRVRLPKQQAFQMKPWMLGMMLTLLETQQAGYDSEYGADVHLLRKARELQKPVVELESLAAQFSLFNSLSTQEQQMFLQETVDGIESGKSRMQVATLIEAWASADRARLGAVLQEESLRQSSMYRSLYEKLLTQRNAAMADKIGGYLESGDQYFVAIGTLHLLGEGSVVDLLAQRGFIVRTL